MFYVYYMYYISEPHVLHLCYISDLCITYINPALDTATSSYSDKVSDLVIGPLFRKVYICTLTGLNTIVWGGGSLID